MCLARGSEKTDLDSLSDKGEIKNPLYRKPKDEKNIGGTKEDSIIPQDEQKGALNHSAYSMDVNEDEKLSKEASREKKRGDSTEGTEEKIPKREAALKQKKAPGNVKKTNIPGALKKRKQ
ncbi:hypothetical protein COOONC_10929 [Cooperia oncophora]